MRSLLKTTISNLIMLLVFVLVAIGCSKKPEKHHATSPRGVLATSTVLATIADDEIADSADPNLKHTQDKDVQIQSLSKKHPQADFAITIHKSGRGVAYIAKVGMKVHVVHNGKKGKYFSDIDVNNFTLSPDGQRIAYAALDGDKWVMIVDDIQYGLYTNVGPPVFSPDSRHVAFECKIVDSWYINVDGKKSPPVETYNDKPEFSSDSNYILFYENATKDRKERIGISDLQFGKIVYKYLTGTILFNNDKSRVALVSQVGNKQRLVEFSFSNPEDLKEGALYDAVAERRFSNDGTVVAYIAIKGKDKYMVMNDKEELLPAGDFPWPFAIRPDNKGVGIFVVNGGGVSAYFYQVFYGDGAKGATYKEGSDLTYSKDSHQYAYVAIKNERFFIVLDGKDGPAFDRVISPIFSPDGKYLVYRARQDGKRFVVVADTLSGNILKKHPSYERVFETTFTDDGKSVAYGVLEGKQIIWKVEKL